MLDSGALSSVYPNIIEAVEENDGEVNCMTRIGKKGVLLEPCRGQNMVLQ